MSTEKPGGDGAVSGAGRIARGVWDYIRSDGAKARVEQARRKAVEVGGMASTGAKKLVEGTRQAAAQVKDRADEYARSEQAQVVRAKAKDGWEEIRAGRFRGGRLAESRLVVALSLLLCFPLGLYLLWRHPTLSRNPRWWLTGGVWALSCTLFMLGAGERDGQATGSPGPGHQTSALSSPAAGSTRKSSHFTVWTEPVAELIGDRRSGGEAVRDIDLSPDGKYLYTDGCLWRIDGWRLLMREMPNLVGGGLFSPDGQLFAQAKLGDLFIWKITDDGPEIVESYEIASRGDYRDKALSAFPYEASDTLWTPFGIITKKPGISTARGPIPSQGGKSPKESQFPFLEAGSRRMWFKMSESIREMGNAAFAFSATGRLMARLSDSNRSLAANGISGYEELPHRVRVVEVWAWPGDSRKPLFRTRVTGDQYVLYENQIAFLPDGKTFVLTYTEEGIRHVVLYDTSSWKETNRFVSDETNFRIAAISPDGSIIASTSGGSAFGSHEDYTVTLWSPTSPDPLRSMRSLHAEHVLFTPDGKTLVTSIGPSARSGERYHINFFEVATGTCVGRIEDEGICGIALSPDGKLLVSGHGDSIAKVWDLTLGQQATYEDEYEPYNRRLAEQRAEDERLSRPAPPMSRAVFNSLQEGMTYLEVRELVGGTEHTSESDMRKVDFRYHSYRTIYVLGYRGNGGPGSGAVLVFGRDSMANLPACKLIGKRQTGLE